jgi:DNA-binding PadR family transcriptional regulator
MHRMEERKLVSAEWGVTDNGRRARYYTITREGRAHLRAQAADLVDHMGALSAVLDAARR